MSSWSWTRTFSYYFGDYDSYPTDIPHERDVAIRAVCMRQVALSKLKLKHVETKKRTPPDLIKIPGATSNIKIKSEYEIIDVLPQELKRPLLVRQRAMEHDFVCQQVCQQAQPVVSQPATLASKPAVKANEKKLTLAQKLALLQ